MEQENNNNNNNNAVAQVEKLCDNFNPILTTVAAV
jgi:hypothetical protein